MAKYRVAAGPKARAWKVAEKEGGEVFDDTKTTRKKMGDEMSPV